MKFTFIYLRVEINRGGGFGPFFAHFRTLNKNFNFPIYLRVEINRGGGFGPFYARFRTLNKNFLNISFGCLALLHARTPKY